MRPATRHRPETTLLYQLIEQHYPAFRLIRATAGRTMPEYVQEEFEAYLASIEEPEVIAKILSHLQRTAPHQYPSKLPQRARTSPMQSSML